MTMSLRAAEIKGLDECPFCHKKKLDIEQLPVNVSCPEAVFEWSVGCYNRHCKMQGGPQRKTRLGAMNAWGMK